ncbi:hypothetical protein BGZ63DRAFT_465004 [Mariannaea sp. PMI_226]|nr:hypothetical protein BGZ63DRAFT_465004 [Mariannaea sp. PMI_226]
MAEAFGIAAGAVGFVSLLVQVTSGINKLRDITNSEDAAPAELDSLMRELDFLVHVMREANDKAPSQNDANCDQVVRDLEVLNKVLATGSKRNVKGKVFGILAFRHWKGNVEVLHRNIQAAKLSLVSSPPVVLAEQQLGFSDIVWRSHLAHGPFLQDNFPPG